MISQDKVVAVLGASDKPDRFSNKAVRLLKQHGYHVIPVHPRLPTIEGFPVVNSLDKIREIVHTLSIYISPDKIGPMIDSIVHLHPKRVILNPGTESEKLMDRLKENDIPFLTRCTLVLLNSGEF